MMALLDLVRSTLESEDGTPRVVHSGDSVEPFQRITLERLDEFLASGNLRPPQFALVSGGQRVPTDGYRRGQRYPGPGEYRMPDTVDYGGLEQAVKNGHTLMLHGCDQWLPDLAAATNSMREYLRHPVLATMFLTPADEVGLAVHSDPYDSFVIQLHGTKAWKVYDRLPEEVPIGVVRRDLVGEPRLAARLTVGDILFLPRGCPHVARADDLSLHVTLGISRLTVRDLLSAVLRGREVLPAELNQPLPLAPMPPDRLRSLLEPGLDALVSQLEASPWAEVLAGAAGSTLPLWQPGAFVRMSAAARGQNTNQ